jgi:hypothetical protein
MFCYCFYNFNFQCVVAIHGNIKFCLLILYSDIVLNSLFIWLCVCVPWDFPCFQFCYLWVKALLLCNQMTLFICLFCNLFHCLESSLQCQIEVVNMDIRALCLISERKLLVFHHCTWCKLTYSVDDLSISSLWEHLHKG